ncbi:MAG: hypothetical protein QXR53_00255 [Candidatus Norongarragalinales archaeon]
MEKLSEKAAVVSGAITGAALHGIFGLLVLGTPAGMMGAYGSMYYGMMQFASPAFAIGAWVTSIVLGLIVGGFVGWLIAVSYNWGLKATSD